MSHPHHHFLTPEHVYFTGRLTLCALPPLSRVWTTTLPYGDLLKRQQNVEPRSLRWRHELSQFGRDRQLIRLQWAKTWKHFMSTRTSLYLRSGPPWGGANWSSVNTLTLGSFGSSMRTRYLFRRLSGEARMKNPVGLPLRPSFSTTTFGG
jgi:hypothetical protein